MCSFKNNIKWAREENHHSERRRNQMVPTFSTKLIIARENRNKHILTTILHHLLDKVKTNFDNLQ